MSSTTRVAATLDELARVEGKAELIAGEIVHLMATGRKPNRIAFRMARSLDDHAQTTRAVFFWMERSRKMGLALARDERCLSHFSGLIPTIRSNENRSNLGEVYTDNVGFAVPMLPSGRQSFSPDASYFLGPFPVNEMRFLEGAPTFAVEVRSENDYTDAAELAMAAKRADYFRGGHLGCLGRGPFAITREKVSMGFARRSGHIDLWPGGRCRAGGLRLEDGGGSDFWLIHPITNPG